jgi:NAD(P)-dependent dehydrogenase (short-subunit alcohol dehydrogenase family)
MDLELAGKKALVTGASRGIGFAIVEALLSEGAAVSFSARGEDGIDAALASLKGQVSGHVVDSADSDAVVAWVQDQAAALGGLDIVISNTSAGGGVDMGLDGWKQSVQTDLLGTAALIETALPHLERSKGNIVQIATITATEDHDFPGNPSYGAVKAALVRYMGRVAKQYGPQGVRANTVSPGPIYIKDGVWQWVQENMGEYYERDVKAHPQGRMGTAQEVADAVLFLASERARWITGQNLCVDGGFTHKVHF